MDCQTPLSMEFSRQEYRGGLPCPPPGDLLEPGIELKSPPLQADSLLSESPGKHQGSLVQKVGWGKNIIDGGKRMSCREKESKYR